MMILRGDTLKDRIEEYLSRKADSMRGTVLGKYLFRGPVKVEAGCNYLIAYHLDSRALALHYHHDLPDGGWFETVSWERIERHLLSNKSLMLVDPVMSTRELGKVVVEWTSEQK